MTKRKAPAPLRVVDNDTDWTTLVDIGETFVDGFGNRFRRQACGHFVNTQATDDPQTRPREWCFQGCHDREAT